MESLAQANQLLVKIYTDDIFREYFFDNPTIAFKHFKLIPPSELASLRQLNKENITLFSNGLTGKLREAVAKHYSPLFSVYKKQMEHIFAEFYQDRKLGGNESILSYSAHFGEFLQRRLFNIEPNKLFDVVKFLAQKCQALDKSLPPICFPRKAITLAAMPCLAPHASIEAYQYDMVSLVQDIENNLIAKSPTAYLMMATDEKLSVMELSMAAFDFLAKCNGCLSIAFIIKQLRSAYGNNEQLFDELVREFVPRLLEKSVIYLR